MVEESIELVKSICQKRLKELNIDDEKYNSRLNEEYLDLENWRSIKNVDMASKLITKMNKGKTSETNNSGSLVLFLLGISKVDPIEKGLRIRKINLIEGDCPDIDTDFDPRCREWVKNRIVELFGEKNVCSIGSYVGYKTRAVLIDVARALGLDVHEIEAITKEMDPLGKYQVEDEDGEEEETRLDKMSFDDLKKQFPKLKKYLEDNPDVERHALILRNQVKNMGKHAGGLIISNLNLLEELPVFKDKKSGSVVSCWTEGLSGRELSNIGVVKFDILGSACLSIIKDCLDLIKESKGIEIKRSDVPIDDKEAIEYCSKGDLIGIFQLENPATKEMVDDIGMNSLNDVSAITSLLRPGPRNMGMDKQYAINKKNSKYKRYPELIQQHLNDTYSILCYQEQIMLISQTFAGFTPVESNQLRSVLAKKKVDKVIYFKEKFINGALSKQEEHQMPREEIEKIWELMESFAEYGFNKCIDKNTLVETMNGDFCKIIDLKIGTWIKAPCDKNNYKFVEVLDVISNGKKDCYEITTKSGKKITCTLDHKVLCEDGKVRQLEEIIKKGYKITTIENIEEIISIKHIGQIDTMDIEVNSEDHLFFGNDIAVSNSHAVSYSALTTCELWLKHHYKTQYMTALLNVTKANKEKYGTNIFICYLNYCRKCGITILPPCVNKSKIEFSLEEDSGKKLQIRFALNKIKQVGSASEAIIETQPYVSFEDFYERVNKRKVNKRVMESLIGVDAFHSFGTKEEIFEKYYKLRGEKEFVQKKEKEWKKIEKEYLGICLSEPPLRIKYKKEDREYKFIGERKTCGTEMFLGRVENIKEAISSKSKKPLLIVEITDDIDNMTFFVFHAVINKFTQEIKKGDIIKISLATFPDSDARFFKASSDKSWEILEKA